MPLHRKNSDAMIKKTGTAIFFIILATTTLTANIQSFKEDSLRSRMLYNKGVDLTREANYSAAIDTFKASLKIRKEIFGDSSNDVAIAHNALGVNYKNLGDFDKAIDHYLRAEKSYHNDYQNNELRIARLYNNIGNLYKNKINYPSALDYYNRAMEIYFKQPEVDLPGVADIYYNMANINYELSNYSKTLQIIEENLPRAYPDTKIYFLSLKAAALQELDETEKAYQSYLDAIKAAENYYSETNINVVFEYLNFATFLISANNFDRAEAVLNKAYGLFEKNEMEEGSILALYYKTRGSFYEYLNVNTRDLEDFRAQKSKNLEESIACYKKGLKALNFDMTALSDSLVNAGQSLSLTQSLEFLKMIADTYHQIAMVFEETKQKHYKQSLSCALDYYKVTSGLIRQARREIYSDESKIQLSALEEATFHNIIHTAYKAFKINEDPKIAQLAFSNADRMKSSSVFDRITDQMAKENSLIPDSLTEHEKSLNFQITSNNEKRYQLTSSEDPNPAQIARIDSVLFHLKKQREALNQYLEKNYSDFYQLKYSEEGTGIPGIQEKMKSDEAIIEYVLDETDSIPTLYSFFITPQKSRFQKHPIDSAFLCSIEKTYRFMSNTDFLFTRQKDAKGFCMAAHYLYKKLIAPYDEQIKNKKITIIPDGKLNYLAFEALLESLPDTSSRILFNRLPYLIRSNTINYAYSANLLYKFQPASRKARNRILAFAPDYEPDTIKFEHDEIRLTPLPGIRREVNLISEEVKTRLFRGAEASEANFRKHSMDYDIIHLAMHAFINDSLPAFSRFAFSQNSKGDTRENDGWLNTADIYNLDLNARLTVLSACNTGSGKLQKGAGVMSLARGFLYAGCPSIVMTQWEVEDNAGTAIMSSFYKHLKKGEPVPEALRKAKLSYLEEANPRMAHPHYWLGYVSIGAPAPLYQSHDLYFFGLLILALLGIAIDQTLQISRRRHNKKQTK